MSLFTAFPNSIALSIGPVSIHWYGLLLAVGLCFGYALIKRLVRFQKQITEEQALGLYVLLIIWGFIGARAYHVITQYSFYVNNLAEVIAVWHGGLAIHGALIAGALVLWRFAKQHKASFFALADLLVIPVILGQAIGRWGNYFNQELYGLPTEQWFGIPIDIFHRVPRFEAYTRFHPAFLYESIANVLIFCLLYYFYTKKRAHKGIVFWLYVLLYSMVRIGMEFIRIDQSAIVFGVRLPMVTSMVLAGLSMLFLIWLNEEQIKNKQ